MLEHTRFFDQMVNAIPPNFYIPAADAEDQPLHKYAHSKKSKAPKMDIKEIKEAARRAKRQKLNPEVNVPTAERIVELAAEAEAQPPAPMSVRHMETLTLEELKARLANKISALRTKRKADDSPHQDQPGGDEPARKRARKEEPKKQAASVGPKPNRTPPRPIAPKSPTGVDAGPVFSKFDFSATAAKKKSKPTPAQMMEQIQRAKEKEARLKEIDPEKAEVHIKTEKWKKALARAQGEKVRDDPKLIAKTMKRIEKQKSKSAKQWTERVDSVKESMKARQEKRTANLKQRKDARKDRKINRGKKRPGFEGGKKSPAGKNAGKKSPKGK